MPSKSTLSLKQRVLKSGSWTLAGYGLNQFLRFAGNLILTRLLFPEAFGLMAIYQAVNYGVHMLSDVGVNASIVQNKQGNDPAFLNTAWTVQIVRGILAWAVLSALAYPMAALYGEPLLAAILPLAGLTAIIGGFNSTKWHTAQRNMEAVRVTKIEVVTYATGLLSTIILAWLMQSVWALVWGNVITSLLKLFASHVYLHGISNRFAWDREALSHLRGFGRWIMLGSALTFLSSEGARLLLGAMLDMQQLALFTLASTMSMMFAQAAQQVVGRVFFPAFAEVHRTTPEKLMAVLYKARLAFILPSWLLGVGFVFFGTELMSVLYDERYHGSGPMLELLAAGSLVGCVWGSYSHVLLAMGKAATETVLTAFQIVFQIASIYIGFHYWGATGIVAGVAAANWMMYPVRAYVMHRNGLWQYKLDLVMLAASTLIVMTAWSHLAADV